MSVWATRLSDAAAALLATRNLRGVRLVHDMAAMRPLRSFFHARLRLGAGRQESGSRDNAHGQA